MNNQYKLLHDRYYLIQNIGQGQFGCVYKAYDKQLSKYVAIKEVKHSFLDENGEIGERLFSAEINGMKYLTNPHLLHCYEVYTVRNQQNGELSYFIVMDYCNGGSLDDYLKQHIKINQDQALEYLRQILIGLSELHKNKVLHRDLKLANIMFKDGKIIIIDLGFAKQVSLHNNAVTTLGTPGYMAPEILDQQGSYDSKVDIFSLGVIFYELLFGYEPFLVASQNPFLILKEYKKDIKFSELVHISEDCKDLILNMLKYESKERIGFKKLYDHQLIQAGNGRNIHNLDFNQLNSQIYEENNLQPQLIFKSFQQLQQEFIPAQIQTFSCDAEFTHLMQSFEQKKEIETKIIQQFMKERNQLMIFETVGLRFTEIFPNDAFPYFFYYGFLNMKLNLLPQLNQKFQSEYQQFPQLQEMVNNENIRVKNEVNRLKSICMKFKKEQFEYKNLFKLQQVNYKYVLKSMIKSIYPLLKCFDDDQKQDDLDVEYMRINKFQRLDILIITILIMDCVLYEQLIADIQQRQMNIDEYMMSLEFKTKEDLLSFRFIRFENLDN